MHEFVWPCFVKHGMQSCDFHAVPKPLAAQNRARPRERRARRRKRDRTEVSCGFHWLGVNESVISGREESGCSAIGHRSVSTSEAATVLLRVHAIKERGDL